MKSLPNPRILILHLSRLGDMIQSLPAVKLLKEAHPRGSITFFGIDDFLPLLQCVPEIDRIVALPASEMGALREEGRAAATADRFLQEFPPLREEYDLLLNWTHNAVSAHLSSKIRASRKSGRVFLQEGEIVIRGDYGKYLFAVSRHRKDNLLNLVDLYVGMAGLAPQPVKGYLPSDAPPRRRAAGPSIGFQLGASNARRTWPIESFLSLGARLHGDLRASVVLFGSAADRKLADAFVAAAVYPVVDLVGRVPLRELPARLKALDLLVTNDTGPMHIAAAVETRVVGIFNATAHFRITGPYGEGHICLQNNLPCCPCLPSHACAAPVCRDRISVHTALAAAKSALGFGDAELAAAADAGAYRSRFLKAGTLGWERIGGNGEGFPCRLDAAGDLRASIIQPMWNRWLEIPDDPEESHQPGPDPHLDEIRRDLLGACRTYRERCRRAQTLCRQILDEFRSGRPKTASIERRIASLRTVEDAFRLAEGHLGILQDIHELAMAEIPPSTFPDLARELLTVYADLAAIVDRLESALKEHGPPAVREAASPASQQRPVPDGGRDLRAG
jgi:ADP-heptose:LPS heptosyltransferase